MTSLWIDKYRPNTLAKLTLHHPLSLKLEALARSEDFPHLLFFGPNGAGKKTRVMSLLRELYGSGVEKIKLEHRSFKTSTGKLIEISTVGSNYHVECNPSDAGSSDRFVIQEVIKEIASHGNLQSSLGAPGSRAFKVLLITEADRLSKQAQAALRRTMEKYSSQCRIILLCSSASKIIEPLRSRCLGIRIPAPAPDDIASLLTLIARKESISIAPDVALKIALQCDRNLRRALLMLEAIAMQVAPAKQIMPDHNVSTALPDWEIFIGRLAKEILQEQSPSKLLQSREMFYELLTNCIPAELILSTLLRELMKSLDDTLKHDVVYWAAYYEHRICQGSKEIFHLEAFVAKFMALYKRWLLALFG